MAVGFFKKVSNFVKKVAPGAVKVGKTIATATANGLLGGNPAVQKFARDVALPVLNSFGGGAGYRPNDSAVDFLRPALSRMNSSFRQY